MITLTERKKISKETKKMLIEVGKLIDKNIDLKKEKKCKECKVQLTYTLVEAGYNRDKFCSLWCQEQQMKVAVHYCEECNVVLIPYTDKKTGKFNYMYGKKCDDCVLARLRDGLHPPEPNSKRMKRFCNYCKEEVGYKLETKIYKYKGQNIPKQERVYRKYHPECWVKKIKENY